MGSIFEKADEGLGGLGAHLGSLARTSPARSGRSLAVEDGEGDKGAWDQLKWAEVSR